MPLDYERLIRMPPRETIHTFTTRDTILYALGIGAERLAHIYEDGLVAYPMMSVIAAYPGFFAPEPEYGVTPRQVLHGEQSIRLHRMMPAAGTVRGVTRITDILDKGAKGAVVNLTRSIHDVADDSLIATVDTGLFVRDGGGFGGIATNGRRPHPIPDRPADKEVRTPTRENQAAIYRLSGDYNPLHIDPARARAMGFDKPILHGLCTFGFAGRALIEGQADGDASRLSRLDARFSTPVFPGETLLTRIWIEGKERVAFQTLVEERGVIALTNGLAEFGGPSQQDGCVDDAHRTLWSQGK